MNDLLFIIYAKPDLIGSLFKYSDKVGRLNRYIQLKRSLQQGKGEKALMNSLLLLFPNECVLNTTYFKCS